MVYTHQLLLHSRTKFSLLLLGQMLVKLFHYFLYTLIGLKPEIASVGTDGEQTLVQAVFCNFPPVVHLSHLQQNIERHLRDRNFPHRKYNHGIILGWRWDIS